MIKEREHSNRTVCEEDLLNARHIHRIVSNVSLGHGEHHGDDPRCLDAETTS